ncbi:MAG: GDP-mannose 4,6-dehydratase [Desulfobacterales bacterium]|nr:GDP-mannose 4,6-dehydratase [Desulfobacterales bacterium]
MRERVLITGGAGFIGSHLTEALLERGYTVTVLDVVPKEAAWRLKGIMDRIDYRWQSVFDVWILNEFDVVCHLAAVADVPYAIKSPLDTVYQNVMGTLTMLEALRRSDRVRRFIYTSSEAAYGSAHPKELPVKENQIFRPKNPYDASKASGDLMTQAYFRGFNCPTVVVRSSANFGPRMRPKQAISIFLRQALKGEPITVEGGEQTRDFVYVANFVDGITKVIETSKDIHGEAFNLGTGRELTILEVAQKCIDVTNSDSSVKILPYRGGEKGVRIRFDITKARRILGYEPKITFEEGLRRTAEWMRTAL